MAIPKLMAISDPRARRQAGRQGEASHFEDHLQRWLEAGVDTIQIREKGAHTRQLWNRAGRAVAAFGASLNILVNSRADVAVAAGAHGVHLPARGAPPAAIRERFGDRLTIGVSTHSFDEIRRAAAEGADYATFSPIYATPSKAGFGPPQGLEALRQATTLGLPIIALGGIRPEVIGEVLNAGAYGIAAIRAFHHPSSLRELMEAYRQAIGAEVS